MNGKDKISVIIPCYNVQKYIMRCFDSIYSQTYGFENLEVILIDDLSTDNTWSMSWRESLCITMSSVTERISSRSMSISK